MDEMRDWVSLGVLECILQFMRRTDVSQFLYKTSLERKVYLLVVRFQEDNNRVIVMVFNATFNNISVISWS